MSPLPELDLWLGGRLRLHQPPRGAHRAGTDAVLLSALGAISGGETVVDAGASTGAVGLAAALRAPGCHVMLVERDPMLAALAQANVEANELQGRVEVRTADLLASGAHRRAVGLPAGSADWVLTNPPYFAAADHRASPEPEKAQAHTFPIGADLDAWLRACVDMVRPGGCLGLIYRADGLARCLDAMRGRFGAIRLRGVHPRADRPAVRVLVAGIKGSRAPLRIEPSLVLHEADGRFTSQVEALHRGEGGVLLG